MAAVTTEVMREAMTRYNTLVAVHDSGESNTRTVLTGYCGIDDDAVDMLVAYVEAIDGDEHIERDRATFTAGFMLGAMVMKEGEALPTVPDAPPADL